MIGEEEKKRYGIRGRFYWSFIGFRCSLYVIRAIFLLNRHCFVPSLPPPPLFFGTLVSFILAASQIPYKLTSTVTNKFYSALLHSNGMEGIINELTGANLAIRNGNRQNGISANSFGCSVVWASNQSHISKYATLTHTHKHTYTTRGKNIILHLMEHYIFSFFSHTQRTLTRLIRVRNE